jgi:acyl-CoA synthetase (AMP-forming)/AMP-acid ligase II
MDVPLTTQDFIDRAEVAYGEVGGVIDEPGIAGALGTLSYAELAARARAFAAALDDLGLPAGARVAVVSPNCARFLVALHGATGSGRILVPVNFRLKPGEVRFIIEHCGAELLLVDPELDVALGELPVARRLVLDGAADAELFGAADGEPAHWEPDEDAVATINYTSGTTSDPKGVMLTHRNLWLNAVTFGWHMGLSDRDVYLHTLPQFHVNGWGVPLAATAMGIPQVMLRKIDGEEILRRIEQHGVTVFCAAPTVVSAILDAAEARRGRGEPLPGAGTVRALVAGSPPPSAVIERFESLLGWQFNQLYGLTETSPLLTINRARPDWDRLETPERARLLSRAGTPAVGVRLRIDERGELLARSNNVFKGYWERPDLTDEAIREGWFHTGDGGFQSSDGYVTITDRFKDVIISGGENVSSIEVEDRIYQHAAVAEAAVIGVPDEKWGETVKALVVLRDGASADADEIIAFCREGLAHYKCPTSVEVRDELPRTATGKLQKFKLREPYWAGREKGVA